MDISRLSQANQAYIARQTQNKNATLPIAPQTPEVKDDDNKINKALAALGILGTAGIAVACIIRGKKPKNTPKADDIQKLVKQFQDIDFEKGVAKLKDNTPFTGAVEKVSKNGDKLSMEYVNGVLQKSTKTTNGVEVVKEYTNGVVTKKNGQSVDIKKIQDEVKTEQAKLKQLLQDNKLSSADFKKQTDEIKFKSRNNETEIKKAYDSKVEAEKTAKEEAERLARKAQEKAQKEEAERLAKEQQEAAAKAQKEAQEKILNEIIAKEEQELKEFVDKLDEKSIKDLQDIRIPIIDEMRKIERAADENAQALGLEKSNFFNKEAASQEDVIRHKYLEKKLDATHAQETKIADDYRKKLIVRENDKQIKTIHAQDYLTLEEQFALGNYYDEYTCNRLLREKKGDYETDKIKFLDLAFKKAPALEDDAVVYRAVTNNIVGADDFFNSIETGKVILDYGYMSTSTNATNAQFASFAQTAINNKGDKSCIMRIHLPKGTKGIYGGTCEYLLPRNSQIKVNKIEIIDGIKVADCEYILPQN